MDRRNRIERGFIERIITSNEEVIEIRRAGLMFAIEMISFDRVKLIVDHCLENGLIGFWFLSCPNSFRLSPPISISTEEIEEAGQIILNAISATKNIL